MSLSGAVDAELVFAVFEVAAAAVFTALLRAAAAAEPDEDEAALEEAFVSALRAAVSDE